MGMEAELVYEIRSVVGEGPIWDEKRRSLFWVDIEAGTLHEHRPAGLGRAAEAGRALNRSWNLGQRLGFAVLRAGGSFVVGLEGGFYFFDPDKAGVRLGDVGPGGSRPNDRAEGSQVRPADSLAGLEPTVDPETHLPQNRFNDGKVDSKGRLWAGTMNIAGPRKAEAALYRLDPDLSVHKMIDGVTVSNGLGWSPDDREFYYIDTPTRQVRSYAFDAESGELGASRVAVDLSGAPGSPDGMCVDAEGMIWVAEWGGWRLCRWNPKNGALLREVRLPVERVSSCAFGGPDCGDLYVTTASSGMKDGDFAAQPLAGSLFRLRPEAPGLRTRLFGAPEA